MSTLESGGYVARLKLSLQGNRLRAAPVPDTSDLGRGVGVPPL